VVNAFSRACLSLLSVALLVQSPASAQGVVSKPVTEELGKSQFAGDGTELFRALLKLKGIRPVKEEEINAQTSRHDDLIVIILGNASQVHFGPGLTSLIFAQNTMRDGGAVLIASNGPLTFAHGNQIVHFSGEHVECSDPKSILWGNVKDCPFVVPLPGAGKNVSNSQANARKLFGGDGTNLQFLNRVASGSPSYIQISKNDKLGGLERPLEPLAGFPLRCSLDNRSIHPLPVDALFAVGGEREGIVRTNAFLAMASRRVFGNLLLWDENPENLELCGRVIEYLKGPEPHRTRCAFFENGHLITNFDDLSPTFADNQSPPIPQPNIGAIQDKLVDMGNGLLDKLQTENVLNNLLSPFRERILSVLLILAAIAACRFLFWRALTSAKPSNIPAAPKIAAAFSGPPGVFDRRQKELLRRNNIYEPVRDLIRGFFATTGMSGEHGPFLPKVKISGAVRNPDSLRIALKDFWRLAFGTPQIMTVKRWEELELYFDRLRQAHADGKWRFFSSSSPAPKHGL
jgi:hypothetical protein